MLRQQLRQSSARAAGGRDSGGDVPRAAPHRLDQRGPRDKGVRARLHRGRQRLRDAADGPIRHQSAEQARGPGVPGSFERDALERRHRRVAGGAGGADSPRRVRARRRGDRRCALRSNHGNALGHRVRHGRHHRQDVPGRERRAGTRHHLRGGKGQALRSRVRHPAEGAGDRPHRDRRRRGLDRAGRRDGAHEGRAAERRGGPRPGVLRARRLRAHGDGRGPVAGLPVTRVLPGRRDAPGCRGGPRGSGLGPFPPDRPGHHRRGGRRARRRQQQHGRCGPSLHRGEGTRPAPLRAGGHRRGRTGARLRAGPAARHLPHRLPPRGGG